MKEMFDVSILIVSPDAVVYEVEAKLALEQHEKLKINICSKHLLHWIFEFKFSQKSKVFK